ncbi:HipA N-terminal domain-containing protein [Fibrella aquatica]|uniref:HipA N-terminal domain-containing protein n=1 Tax=Fibrella aquatica TaxID=3242487 RepID=UPI00351F87ED
MNRQADVWVDQHKAGQLAETESGYQFSYDVAYLSNLHAVPVSLTLPLRAQPYVDTRLFPFFDGLIPEGWLLEIVEKNWKLRSSDRFGLLLACCRDCIGNVSIIASV